MAARNISTAIGPDASERVNLSAPVLDPVLASPPPSTSTPRPASPTDAPADDVAPRESRRLALPEPEGPSADAPVHPTLTHRQILTVMSGLMIAMMLAQLDNMIISPALPTVVGELGGMAHFAWVTTSYILASTAATLILGKLGDIYSRKTIFMISIVIFLAGSAMSGMSQTMGQLIGFRAIQGIGAGGLIVGVMSIIAVIIPPLQRGKYTGYMMTVMPVSMIAGPLLGGYVTDHFSWRWCFYINIPLGFLALAVIALTMNVPEPPPAHRGIDWIGSALMITWTTALVLVTSWGGAQYAWTSPVILSLGALCAVGLALFIWTQMRVANPILPLRVFTNANFTMATGLAFIVGFALFGSMVFLPQFQQFVQGSSATNSGLLLLPLMMGMMVTSIFAGRRITKTGKYRAFPIAGVIVMTTGLGLMATFTTSTSKATTALYMVILGVGMGCLMQITALIAQNSVPLSDIGAATGAQTFLRSMGGSIGISLMGAMYSHRLTDALGGDHSSLQPGTMAAMPAGVQQLIRGAVTDGVTHVFLYAALTAAVGLFLALKIKEVPLRAR